MMNKLFVVGFMGLLSGCVTMSKHKKDLDAVTMECSATVKNLKANYEHENLLKDERLRRFNQLNPDGSLR